MRKSDKILFGGDYNPEQWSESVWKEDIKLMKAANVNTVTLGVFAWAALESEEGVYDFSWLDKIIEMLWKENIYMVLATPSAATPAWMARQYPEILRAGHNGVRHPHRVRVNYCLSSPKYRERSRSIANELAKRYGKHPALLAWHINNEYHGGCWCEGCQSAFRDWLRTRYETIDDLNEAWWTPFWSHTYMSFDEIDAPQPWPDGEWSVQALWLEWRRFVGVQYTQLFDNESKVISEHSPEVPQTHNMHALINDELLTHWRPLADHLSFISWDCYPEYQNDDKDVRRAINCAFDHSTYRGFKDNEPYAMMESRPCSGPGTKQQRPGTFRRTAVQALGHGADTTQYFQWRDGLGGSEKFHGAMLEHVGHGNTRMFSEISAFGKELEDLNEIIGSRVESSVAIIFDEENHWALELGTTARWDERDHIETLQRYFGAFWEKGINVDVLSQDAFMKSKRSYKTVLAPQLYMVKDGMAEALTAFAEDGGTVVLTCWSGYADVNDKVITGGFPGPLMNLTGVWSEELDAPGETPVEVEITGLGNDSGKRYSAGAFCDYLHCNSAKPLGSICNDYYAGKPALTKNSVGAGSCYYIGFHADEDFLNDFCNYLVENGCANPIVPLGLPEGVTVQSRKNDDTEYLFFHNFSMLAHSIDLSGLNLTPIGETQNMPIVELNPRDSYVFKRIIS